MTSEHLVVLCTCPNAVDADTIATALLEQRLAACVNRVPGISSMYRWQGRVEHDDEMLLVIKTATRHFAELERTIKQLHPAEVPEIIGLPIVIGSQPYLDWIEESVTE
jgi:periplasmic divalent cation tolerance protein